MRAKAQRTLSGLLLHNTRPLSRIEGSSTHARKPPYHSRAMFPGGRFRSPKAAQRRRGHSRATSPLWGVCRRQKWQVNVKAKGRASPRTPSLQQDLLTRLHIRAALVAEGCLNLRLKRKQPSAKSPHFSFGVFYCSRDPQKAVSLCSSVMSCFFFLNANFSSKTN